MDLKLSEDINWSTQYRFVLKNPKKICTLVFSEKFKVPKGIVWPKKMVKTPTASQVQILAQN